MHQKLLYGFCAILLLCCYSSCDNTKPEPPANPCAGVTINVTASVTNATTGQSNGALAATATGASNFTFSINNGPFAAASNFTGLAAGTYTITAKSSDGCTGSGQFTVGTANPCSGVTITVTATVTGATTGQNNGSIAATATGGTGITYSKDGTNFQSSGTFTGLAAGNYTITAKNSNGCTGSATFTVPVSNPCAGVNITVTSTVVNATTGQSNGSITVTATGSSNYTYSKDGTNFQASNVFANLAAGNYTITAKDGNGCTGSAQSTVGTANPCSGVNITVSATVNNATTGQSNGSITASASGSSGFTYSINGTTFQTSNIFSNLAAGNYTITAKDANGCTGTTQATVGSVNPCAGVNITVSTTIQTATPCAPTPTGRITVNASGSTGLLYSLNGGAFQSSNIFNNLSAGNYTIAVKDANNCAAPNTAATVTATPAGPLYDAVRNILQVSCAVGGCHDQYTQQAGINFNNNCDIVAQKDRIKFRAVDQAGTANQMPQPPNPALSVADRQAITNWVNAGGRYSD